MHVKRINAKLRPANPGDILVIEGNETSKIKEHRRNTCRSSGWKAGKDDGGIAFCSNQEMRSRSSQQVQRQWI